MKISDSMPESVYIGVLEADVLVYERTELGIDWVRNKQYMVRWLSHFSAGFLCIACLKSPSSHAGLSVWKQMSKYLSHYLL